MDLNPQPSSFFYEVEQVPACEGCEVEKSMCWCTMPDAAAPTKRYFAVMHSTHSTTANKMAVSGARILQAMLLSKPKLI